MTEHVGKNLIKATKEKLEKFNKLRGKEVKLEEFWDLVVVTAVDEDQRLAYELQINEKLKRKELPLGVNYHVFADPPGCKIGNGGSTMHSLRLLEEKYGNSLRRSRVILIHAGGFSQRLPSASALGKLFMALPLGDPLYQMLELKLAMYVDFPSHMKPGMLVTCSDDIELYSVPDCVVFDRAGFTALAHPSSLSIGTTHGVFVLKPEETSGDNEMEYSSCVCFLHKPSIEKMRKSGAVCKREGGVQASGDAEFVYTDSTYYVDYGTSMKLLALFRELGPLSCEIDAYGDFLQALGPGASVEYTNDTANVVKTERSLVEIRQKIFHHLSGTPLNVVLLNNSKFYHVGTTEEYLFHFTADPCLKAELGLLQAAFSICQQGAPASPVVCVMHSVLHPAAAVLPGSVVEYSRLDAHVRVGTGSIVSGCRIGKDLSVPSETFMHSLCIDLDGERGFVTVAFSVKDDLKRIVASPSDMSDLRLFGSSVEEYVGRWGLDPEDLRFSGEKSTCSLWNACLFPVCSDLSGSFSLTLEMVQALHCQSKFSLPKGTRLISLQEALLNKNLEEMLKFRKGLYEEILRVK